jgi:twitching motility protein PilT
MANQIDPLFEHMISQGGSDLHLSEGEPPKFRRHGAIQPIREERLSGEEIRSLMEEICRETMWEKFIESGDLDFAYEMNAESRFRCNYHRHSNGIGAIFRLIPTKIPTIEQLGLPMVIEREFGNMRSGLVLVTGPTGSGKSTTLAALINYINRTYTRHIITIEEPIEFVHENLKSIITQREVPSETPSFSVGLKASLREDADVVLVGEMRDLETISLALTAAETGLLVFGTLHTNSAAKTIDRVIDAFPAEQQELVRTMLSTSLRGVVAQLLMQKKDGSGRVAVNEIMISSAAVASIIREGATFKLSDVLKSGRADGMQQMDDSIMSLLEKGKVTAREAYMKALDKNRFMPYLEREGTSLTHHG